MENKNPTKSYTPISIKLVQQLFGSNVSKSWVSNKIHLCRDALGKQKGAILTLEEFKDYNNLQ